MIVINSKKKNHLSSYFTLQNLKTLNPTLTFFWKDIYNHGDTLKMLKPT
jgi:hypothetical protein